MVLELSWIEGVVLVQLLEDVPVLVMRPEKRQALEGLAE